MHRQIFELSYFSNGGVNIQIAYDLPIYLRNYYYKTLVDLKQQESKSYEDSYKKPSKNTSKPRIDKPF